MHKKLLVSSFFLFLCVLGDIGEPLHAQEWQGNSWRSRWQASDEGSDINDDDINEWRRQSSRIRDRINDLDDDPVLKLPIPILFGVSLTDIFPNFGDPRDGGTRTHEGLDMLALEGAPVVSPTDAVVIRIGSGASSGNYVSTANPGGETFVYMHLSKVADIDEGDVLDQGDLIGYVGNTGNASGGPPHLHFEIRKERQATDPYARISKEFSLAEKIKILEAILDAVDDEENLALELIQEYEDVFLRARAQVIALPDAIEDELSGGSSSPLSQDSTRDLTVGSGGLDVIVLQSILIAEGYLLIDAPTGYFGPLTESALKRYQEKHGIAPAIGYYGPITRAYMFGGNDSGMSREVLISLIAELTEMVEKLQRELARR